MWQGLAGRFTVASFELVQAARLEQDLPPRERFRALAEVVVAVAQRLGFARCHLFAWYGGSHVALAALRDHPDEVASCILLDPFFELDDMRKIEKAIALKRAIFEADRALYAHYWVMAGFSPGLWSSGSTSSSAWRRRASPRTASSIRTANAGCAGCARCAPTG